MGGRLTPQSERIRLLRYFKAAIDGGASRRLAAQVMNISERTLKRWANNPAPDKRPTATPVQQPRQMSDDEEQRILIVCNLPEYSDLPPSQIVPLLSDKHVYIGSESTIYRVLKKHEQLTHRGKTKPRKKHPLPTTYTATGPNQVYSWDISYCPSNVRGVFWYLYLILDVYSRKIVGWEVHEIESGELAKELVERTLLREGCWHNPPVLHSDKPTQVSSYRWALPLFGEELMR